eukprot:jgi/Tetstr1/428821/TSEL_018808.t1
MSHTQDPFYLVREEIQESLTALEKSYSRLQALPSTIPEFGRLRHEVQEGCESVSWQVDQLQRAIDIAVRNPTRFNLSDEEVESRKQWSRSARQKVDDVRQGLALLVRQADSAASAAAATEMSSAAYRDNDVFIGNQTDRQTQLMRQQDDDLDELSQHVSQIGQIGLTIHEELESQGQLLEELDEDLDATTNRLAAAQKKVEVVLKRAGAKGQMCIIVVLTVILVLLVVFTFT